jgi:hypothetical protein
MKSFILPCIVNAANSTSGPDGQSNLPVLISSLSCSTNKYLYINETKIQDKFFFFLLTLLIHHEDFVDRMYKI